MGKITECRQSQRYKAQMAVHQERELTQMPKDYGYFGKGSSGYAHYNQSFKSNYSGNNGGDDGGCLKLFIGAALLLYIILNIFFAS